jgi:F-type H+-transporting ATPase subunit b
MPQFDIATFASQLFWLTIVFGLLYFVVARSTLPKVAKVIDDRTAKISADLAEAERARAAAAAAQTNSAAPLQAAKAEASRLIEAAKSTVKAEIEAKLKVVDADLAGKAADAEARIQAAKEAALADLNQVAGETTQAIVERVTGASVSLDDALAAVSKTLAKA